MKRKLFFLTVTLLAFLCLKVFSQPIIINHDCAKLEPIPASAIEKAKQTLHIAYAHTSHGSQITKGMRDLEGQKNLKGYKGDIYGWSEGGIGDKLDIDDRFIGGDLGHNGNVSWAEPTRNYLKKNTDVNVVIYSWCGGCSDNTPEGIQAYLDKMNELEQEFTNVKFVYMTGHRDIWADATLKANNQQIRDYCIANDKILYDFADIESYDPDGKYYEFANDNCDYYSGAGTGLLGNWATEWQDSHTEGVDWYDCSAAHSKPLNGNLKAYAAWWLWARLAGWQGTTDVEKPDNIITVFRLNQNYPNPFNPNTIINYELPENGEVLLEVYNSLGEKITTLVNRKENKGVHKVNFSAYNLPSGLYFYRISYNNKIITKKMVLLK
ncbi:MAG: hypothetical protein CR986_08845 [Ignavibacteriae bacterium]|nr:MAG: hypothetical protein CR986_08845 [Ignavibacteriota bacterium]